MIAAGSLAHAEAPPPGGAATEPDAGTPTTTAPATTTEPATSTEPVADPAVVTATATTTNVAAWRRLPIEVGVYTGGFISNYFHQFYDASLFPGQLGAPDAREDLERVSPLFGIRGAYFVKPWLGAEAEFSYISTATKSHKAASIYDGRLQVIFQAPQLSRWIIPYATLGDGFARVSSARTVLGSDTDWPVHVGAGARVLLDQTITVRVDLRLLRAPSQQAPYHLNASLGEVMLGVSWRPASDAATTRAASRGPDTSDVPLPPRTVDADADGVVDASDQCPREPEDQDLFDDTDGCPDPDNDGDGVLDVDDKCPLDDEDKDGFADDDGCVDRDNDADGINDAADKCPNEAEDRDGFKDTDGCAELDNDGDTIPDDQDRCPNEAEVINGTDDEDGCADRGNPLVIVSPDRLELLEPIAFKKTAIQRESFNVMAQLGATLRVHKEITRLRLTVHVQPTKDPVADKQLSEARALALREWLIKYGIAEKRLDPRGFGGTMPLVAPKSRNAADINNRVDLIVLERE